VKLATGSVEGRLWREAVVRRNAELKMQRHIDEATDKILGLLCSDLDYPYHESRESGSIQVSDAFDGAV